MPAPVSPAQYAAPSQVSVSTRNPVPSQHPSGGETPPRAGSTRNLPSYGNGDRYRQQLLIENLRGPYIPCSGNVSLATREGEVAAALRHNGFVLLNRETQEPVRHPNGQPVRLMKTSDGKFDVMPGLLGGFDVQHIPAWVAQRILQDGVFEVEWRGTDGFDYIIHKALDSNDNLYFPIFCSADNWLDQVVRLTYEEVENLRNEPSSSYSHRQIHTSNETGQFQHLFAQLEFAVQSINALPPDHRGYPDPNSAANFSIEGRRFYIGFNGNGDAEVQCDDGQVVYAWRQGGWGQRDWVFLGGSTQANMPQWW